MRRAVVVPHNKLLPWLLFSLQSLKESDWQLCSCCCSCTTCMTTMHGNTKFNTAALRLEPCLTYPGFHSSIRDEPCWAFPRRASPPVAQVSTVSTPSPPPAPSVARKSSRAHLDSKPSDLFAASLEPHNLFLLSATAPRWIAGCQIALRADGNS